MNQFPRVRVPHFDGEVTDCCYHQRVIHVPRNHRHSKPLDILQIILVCAKIWNKIFLIVYLLHVYKCLSKTVLFLNLALYLLHTDEIFSFSFQLHYCSDIWMFRIFANLCVPLQCCVHVKYHSPPFLSFVSPYPGCSILTPTDKPVTMVTVTNTVHSVLK